MPAISFIHLYAMCKQSLGSVGGKCTYYLWTWSCNFLCWKFIKANVLKERVGKPECKLKLEANCGRCNGFSIIKGHLMNGSEQRMGDNTGKYILFGCDARLLAKNPENIM